MWHLKSCFKGVQNFYHYMHEFESFLIESKNLNDDVTIIYCHVLVSISVSLDMLS